MPSHLSNMENKDGKGVQNTLGLSVRLVSQGLERQCKSSSANMCIQYHLGVEGKRNFIILGADSIWNSNIRDHAFSDQHAHAMQLLRKGQAQAKGFDSYAPIVKVLNQSRKVTETLRIILLLFLLLSSYLSLTTQLFVNWSWHMVLLVQPVVSKMLARPFVTSLQSLEESI